jgi:hypothetical protein
MPLHPAPPARSDVHRAIRPPGNPPLDPAAVLRSVEALERVLGG